MDNMKHWEAWNDDGLAWPVPADERDGWAKDQLDPNNKYHTYEAVATLTLSGDSIVVTFKWPGGRVDQYDCKIRRLRDNGGLYG